MRILFVHTNFPGQFGNLASALHTRGHEVRALTPALAQPVEGVEVTLCAVLPAPAQGYANLLTSRFEADTLRSQSAFAAARGLAASGYAPDVIIGHPAFGEMTLLDLIWPDARRIIYGESFVSAQSMSSKFDPEFPPPNEVEQAFAQLQEGNSALAVLRADALVSPTEFQRNKFPPLLRQSIRVIPDGIDTAAVRPRADARFAVPNTDIVLRPGDEVVTYVNRHLEPLRGIHIFLRSLIQVLRDRPNARVLIVGAPHSRHYGLAPPDGRTWVEIFAREVQSHLDASRVHFLGVINRAQYLDVLAVSAAHVYLTYPFVVSWSLLEAMSAGCAIIGSDTAPVTEFIEDGRNGRLVDFFNPGGLANAICEILENPATVDAYRARARADAVARCDFATVALPAWLDLIEA